MNALKSILGGQKKKKKVLPKGFIFLAVCKMREQFSNCKFEKLVSGPSVIFIFMPGDFCQKQRSPEEKFFNLSGSENLKNKAAKKKIFFARLDC